MFTEDLTPFFDDSAFAEVVLIDGSAFLVIFDAPSEDALGMATTEPRITMPSDQAATAGLDATSVVSVRGTLYRARMPIVHDGTGVCTVRLERSE